MSDRASKRTCAMNERQSRPVWVNDRRTQSEDNKSASSRIATFERRATLMLAKLAQCGNGLSVGCSTGFQALLATKARRLERSEASFGLPAASSIDSDLTTAGITAIHPLLCSENIGARVSIA